MEHVYAMYYFETHVLLDEAQLNEAMSQYNLRRQGFLQSMFPNLGVVQVMLYEILAFVAIAALLLTWLIVAWHRYVLLDEQPVAIFPRLSLVPVISYFLMALIYGIIIGVLTFIATFLLSILMGVIAVSAYVGGASILPIQMIIYAFVIGLFIIVPITVFSFRLTSTLPAFALGAPVGFLDGWIATRHNGGSIIVVSVFSVLAFGAEFAVRAYLAVYYPEMAFLWQMVVGWIAVMVSASILTTLYGHYIEGRPLVV